MSPADSSSKLPVREPVQALRMSVRHRQVSPVAERTWRLAWLIAAGCLLLLLVSIVPGLSAAIRGLLALAVAGPAWVLAIRLLLLDSRGRRFWQVWLGLSVIGLPLAGSSPAGMIVASCLGAVFLIFRRHKPLRHLSSIRRAQVFLLGLVSLILLLAAGGLPEPKGWLPGVLIRTGSYASFMLEIFWGLALLKLFFGLRLHFMRLKPKLAVTALLFALVPLVLLAVLASLAIYGSLGGSRASECRSVLQEWTRLVDRAPEAGDQIFSSFGEFELTRSRPTAGVPDWLESLVAAADTVAWMPADTTALATADGKFWVLRIRGLKQPVTRIHAYEIDAPVLERLSKLLHCTVEVHGKDQLSIRAGEDGMWISVSGSGEAAEAQEEPQAAAEGDAGRIQSAPGGSRRPGVVQSRSTHAESTPTSDGSPLPGSPPTPGRSGAPEEASGPEGSSAGADSLPPRGSLSTGGLLSAGGVDGGGTSFGAEGGTRIDWGGPLYFGAVPISVLSLRDGKLQNREALLAIKIRLADLLREYTSGDNVFNRALAAALAVVAGLFLILEGFALFFGLRITGGITSAVQTLHRGTERLARGDLDVYIEVPNEDEFGDLAASFNEMTGAVKLGQEQAVARERLEQEILTARRIQERLLPRGTPRVPGFEIAGKSLPSRQVGGDYYDFVPLPDGRLGIALGDVSGKGIPAALLMANLQASLQGQVIHRSSVSEVVSRVNDLLTASTDPHMFATFLYGVLDPEAARLTLVNAGHDAPILCRPDGTVSRPAGSGLVLGMLPGQSYPETDLEMKPGDVLVMFTDGITEAIGPKENAAASGAAGASRSLAVRGSTHAAGSPDSADLSGAGEPSRSGRASGSGKGRQVAPDPDDEGTEEDPASGEPADAEPRFFGEERLLSAVQRWVDASAEEIRDGILEDVFEHTRGAAQSDDITLVVVKRV